MLVHFSSVQIIPDVLLKLRNITGIYASSKTNGYRIMDTFGFNQFAISLCVVKTRTNTNNGSLF